MEISYWIEAPFGSSLACVEIMIPLASATMGQNYVHAGFESIGYEIQCAAKMARLILVTLGFTPEEVQCFIANAETELLELTWHTPTASEKALRSLQDRTTNVFESMKSNSGRHDIPVADVDYRRKNGKPGLFVTFKNGDEYRQYGKYDQSAGMSKKGKHRYAVSADMKRHEVGLLDTIKTHCRNEARLGHDTLKSLGLLNPSAWTADNLKAALDSYWLMAGLAGATVDLSSDKKPLSSEVQVTLDRYQAGDATLEASLPPYTFTRHRIAIKDFNGQDIAARLDRNLVRPDAVGYQLMYDRRWMLRGDLRALALCEVTAPAVLLDLQRGLDFIESGVIPDIVDQKALAAWLKRWKRFAENEGVISKQKDVPVAVVQPVPVKKRGHGVSGVPVDINSPADELIFVDGEWLVV